MGDKYFLLVDTLEGHWNIEGPMPADKVRKRLAEWKKDEVEVSFHAGLPDITFTNERAPLCVVVIKGDIVVPKPVKVVEKYEIP